MCLEKRRRRERERGKDGERGRDEEREKEGERGTDGKRDREKWRETAGKVGRSFWGNGSPSHGLESSVLRSHAREGLKNASRTWRPVSIRKICMTVP